MVRRIAVLLVLALAALPVYAHSPEPRADQAIAKLRIWAVPLERTECLPLQTLVDEGLGRLFAVPLWHLTRADRAAYLAWFGVTIAPVHLDALQPLDRWLSRFAPDLVSADAAALFASARLAQGESSVPFAFKVGLACQNRIARPDLLRLLCRVTASTPLDPAIEKTGIDITDLLVLIDEHDRDTLRTLAAAILVTLGQRQPPASARRPASPPPHAPYADIRLAGTLNTLLQRQAPEDASILLDALAGPPAILAYPAAYRIDATALIRRMGPTPDLSFLLARAEATTDPADLVPLLTLLRSAAGFVSPPEALRIADALGPLLAKLDPTASANLRTDLLAARLRVDAALARHLPDDRMRSTIDHLIETWREGERIRQRPYSADSWQIRFHWEAMQSSARDGISTLAATLPPAMLPPLLPLLFERLDHVSKYERIDAAAALGNAARRMQATERDAVLARFEQAASIETDPQAREAILRARQTALAPPR